MWVIVRGVERVQMFVIVLVLGQHNVGHSVWRGACTDVCYISGAWTA